MSSPTTGMIKIQKEKGLICDVQYSPQFKTEKKKIKMERANGETPNIQEINRHNRSFASPICRHTSKPGHRGVMPVDCCIVQFSIKQ